MFDFGQIFNWVKKNISIRDVCIILGLIVLYALTRIVNLDKFPIFTDEGIYIRWAKVAWHDATWRFISLTDGRQPLQTWGTIPFLKLFPDNALFAGRLFSVTSGFITLTGIFTTTYYLFNKKTAYISSFLYVITPMFLFHDRMALVDSAVSAGVIWMFFLSIIIARFRRLDATLLLGMVGGLSLLTKSSVKLFLSVTFFSVVYILFEQNKNRINKLISFGFLNILAFAIAYAIYNVQRLSPFFQFVSSKNNTFVLTFAQLLNNPFELLLINIKKIPYYLLSEMGYVIPILGIIGLIILVKKKNVSGYFLSLWILVVFFLISLVAMVLYPRYIMSLGVLLLIPSGYLIASLNSIRSLWVLILAVLSIFYFNYTILFDHAKIPFPQVDRGQYIEDWPAGWGIKEIVDYARETSGGAKVKILAEGDFGMSGDLLESHLQSTDTNIEIKGYWPLDLSSLDENRKLVKNQKVLIVFSHRNKFEESWPMRRIAKYDKPGGKSAIYLYELTQ